MPFSQPLCSALTTFSLQQDKNRQKTPKHVHGMYTNLASQAAALAAFKAKDDKPKPKQELRINTNVLSGPTKYQTPVTRTPVARTPSSKAPPTNIGSSPTPQPSPPKTVTGDPKTTVAKKPTAPKAPLRQPSSSQRPVATSSATQKQMANAGALRPAAANNSIAAGAALAASSKRNNESLNSPTNNMAVDAVVAATMPKLRHSGSVQSLGVQKAQKVETREKDLDREREGDEREGNREDQKGYREGDQKANKEVDRERYQNELPDKQLNNNSTHTVSKPGNRKPEVDIKTKELNITQDPKINNTLQAPPMSRLELRQLVRANDIALQTEGFSTPKSRRSTQSTPRQMDVATPVQSSAVYAAANASAASLKAETPGGLLSGMSSEAELGGEGTLKKRHSSHDPKEMIAQIKDSIRARADKSKAVLGLLTAKNRAMIDGIRRSIDSKYILTQSSTSVDDVRRTSTDQGSIASSVGGNGGQVATDYFANNSVPGNIGGLHSGFMNNSGDFSGGVYGDESHMQSYSSLDSALLETSESPSMSTPVIVVAPELPEPRRSSSDTRLTRLGMGGDSGGEESFLQPRVAGMGATPSSSQVARNQAMTGSSDALMSALQKTPVQEKGKPKRKPPQFDDTYNSPLLSPIAPRDDTVSRVLSRSLFGDEYEDVTDEDATGKPIVRAVTPKEPRFPQYPELSKHTGEHKLFKRKQRAKGSVVNLEDLANEAADESDDLCDEAIVGEKVATPVTPAANTASAANPVRLKTTMRNTKKRDKKAFNENKPWKHHKELYYIAEPERKRYEGVWASNRGNYITSFVTPIRGLDYSTVHNPSFNAQEKEEVSMKAARLSLEAKKMDATADEEVFHGLKRVETGDLIHGAVVLRLWRRSRLPNETLEQIWDLVDFRKDGTLNKPEFLVGMWLVDQCLYGRKLPKRVNDSIWDSLGSIGVSVALKKKR